MMSNRMNSKSWSFGVAVLAIAVASGCGPRVVRAVTPRPTTILPAGRYALALAPEVLDTQNVDRSLIVEQFRETLATGFHNAFAHQSTSDLSQQPTMLAIDECGIEVEQVGYLRVLVARVRGRWLAPDGTQVSQFAGRAVPRNPMGGGGAERQLADLMEAMFEEIITDFTNAQREDATASAGGEQSGGGIH